MIGEYRKLYSKESTKENRKRLRRNMTKEEIILWAYIRAKKVLGIKFRSQHGISKYIADFYAPSIKLVIELDGNQHYTKSGLEYDKIRTEVINSFEIEVLRFKNYEIRDDIASVLDVIKEKIKERLKIQ